MKRYFDAVATDGGGVNVAELMAKHGVKTDEGQTVGIPNIDTGEPKIESKAEESPVATETVSTEPKQATPIIESPKPEPVVPIQPAAEQSRPIETDWKEVLKKQPEVDIYKHLGLDEKMINFLSRWKGGEDLKDYLEAATVDYAKLSAEEVMRRYYSQEFGTLSPEDFEEVYRMKVTEHYKLDADVFDEKEVRRGKLLLNYEADKIRQDFIKKQQDLLFSKPPEPQPSQADIEAREMEAERERSVAEYKGRIEKDAFTQELLNKKLMTIGEGEEAFNYEVSEPRNYLDILYDPQKWSSKLFNEDGTPNVRKQFLLAALASDETAFLTNYAKHHQRLGAKKAIEPIENASTTLGTPSNSDGLPSDPAAALARGGTITSGW
jgi:hypothetical protein